MAAYPMNISYVEGCGISCLSILNEMGLRVALVCDKMLKTGQKEGISMSSAVRKTEHGADKKVSMRPAGIGAILLAVAVIIGTSINFISISHEKKAATQEEILETPKVTVVPARPSAAPTATPTVNRIMLYAFGAELNEDGFTAYVGDKAITLSVKLEPSMNRPPVNWAVSDSDSVRLEVSDDRLSCEFTALKPSGKNELTVSCYGAEAVYPIFLWER